MNNKEVKSKTKAFKALIFIIVFGGIGAFIGYVSTSYISSYTESNNGFIDSLILLGLFLIFFIGYFIHIIIHEAGHLIFGLMTGYSFVSFRVGSFIIVKKNGKLEYKRFNLPGTAGQCLMMPPELNNGRFPFVLYNFGGVIMNLIISLFGILIGKNLIFPFSIILSTFSLAGIFAALTNGIPMKIGGVPNDAYNVLSIFRDEEARKGFYVQLKVHGLQSQGIRIKDMPYENFTLRDDSDLSNPLNTAMRLMEYNWHLDNMDLENAKRSIDSLIPYFNKIVPLFRFEINCERMFLELIGNCDKSFINRLYDKDLKKYIKAAKFMINKKRLLMSYEAFYSKDKDKALKYYMDLKELAKNYPVKGETDMEVMLADWIKEKLYE